MDHESLRLNVNVIDPVYIPKEGSNKMDDAPYTAGYDDSDYKAEQAQIEWSREEEEEEIEDDGFITPSIGDVHLKSQPVGGDNMKPTNPKDAVGIRKPRFYSGMSCHVRRLVSIGMMEGAMKYGRHNYRAAGVRASVYYDATNEHLDDWYEGEDIDPDSKLSHVIKAICSLYVLADAIVTGNLVDDRPPRTMKVRDIVNENQKLVNELFERYPNPEQAFTHLNTSNVKGSPEK